MLLSNTIKRGVEDMVCTECRHSAWANTRGRAQKEVLTVVQHVAAVGPRAEGPVFCWYFSQSCQPDLCRHIHLVCFPKWAIQNDIKTYSQSKPYGLSLVIPLLSLKKSWDQVFAWDTFLFVLCYRLGLAILTLMLLTIPQDLKARSLGWFQWVKSLLAWVSFSC